MTIKVRSDYDGYIRANEADLLYDGVPLNIMKRSSLQLGHVRHKGSPTFDSASDHSNEICIGYRRLRIGNLLSIMVIPSYI